MAQVHEPLTAWTFDTVLQIVLHHEREVGQYDYKSVLNASKNTYEEKHAASIRRTVCAMANADGGYILFGVQDRQDMPHVASPRERILGIPATDDFPKHFQDKIKAIQPDVYFEITPTLIALPGDPMRGICVAYIPRSPTRPHMDERTGVFYRRGAGGAAETMRAHEVREAMLNTEERLRKVTLFRLILRQYLELHEALARRLADASKETERFDTATYMSVLADIWHLLPPHEGANNQMLLQIAREVRQINRLLDILFERYKATGKDLSFEAVNLLGLPLNEIAKECQSAEAYLLRIFGSMS